MEERVNQTAGLMTKVRDGAVSQLNTQKDRATDGIGSVVGAVRQSTQKLRDDKHETIANYVEQTLTQVERFADHLKSKNSSELMQDAQRYARRNPAVFIGSAFAAGLLAARFLKSSRNRTTNDWRRPAYGGGFDGPLSSRNFATTPVGTSGATATGRSDSASAGPGASGQRTSPATPQPSSPSAPWTPSASSANSERP